MKQEVYQAERVRRVVQGLCVCHSDVSDDKHDKDPPPTTMPKQNQIEKPWVQVVLADFVDG